MRKIIRLDIHVHTPSSDGKTKDPKAYIKAIKKANLDGICITDHHVSGGEASRAIQKEIRAAGLLCFMGCEYSTNNGHCLIYLPHGMDVDMFGWGKYPPMQRVIWDVREVGGVAIPSHPFYGYKKQLGDDVFRMQDLLALETYNGKVATECHADYNKDAYDAAELMKIPGIGCSDAHDARDIGLSYTEFYGSIRYPGDFLKALTCGDYQAIEDSKRIRAAKKAYSAESLKYLTTSASVYTGKSYGGSQGWYSSPSGVYKGYSSTPPKEDRWDPDYEFGMYDDGFDEKDSNETYLDSQTAEEYLSSIDLTPKKTKKLTKTKKTFYPLTYSTIERPSPPFTFEHKDTEVFVMSRTEDGDFNVWELDTESGESRDTIWSPTDLWEAFDARDADPKFADWGYPEYIDGYEEEAPHEEDADAAGGCEEDPFSDPFFVAENEQEASKFLKKWTSGKRVRKRRGGKRRK